MANTGTKIILTLKEVTVPGGTPTGNTKPNVVGDPDYIPPEEDSPDCPVSTTLTCPYFVATGSSGQAVYELSILNSVKNNSNVDKIKVKLMSGVTLITSNTHTSPLNNYYSSTLSAVAGTYTIDVEYLNSSDVVQATCTGLSTVTIT